MALKNTYLIALMEKVEQRNPNDKQFLVTVRSVLESIEPVVDARPELIEKGVLDMFVEPERVVKFRVPCTLRKQWTSPLFFFYLNNF